MAGYAYLDLDVNGIVMALSNYMATVCDELADEMIKQMYETRPLVGKGFSRSKLEKENSYSKEDAYASLAMVTVTLIQDVYGILASYGTGENKDDYNPYWSDYTSSALFNPLRKNDVIVGRAEGSYTNIFGQPDYSFGTMAGVATGSKGMNPSYAIQNTEKKYLGDEKVDGELLEDGYFYTTLKKSVEKWMEETDFSEYFKEVTA